MAWSRRSAWIARKALVRVATFAHSIIGVYWPRWPWEPLAGIAGVDGRKPLVRVAGKTGRQALVRVLALFNAPIGVYWPTGAAMTPARGDPCLNCDVNSADWQLFPFIGWHFV